MKNIGLIVNPIAGMGGSEVLDIDKEAFRENKIAAKLYGYLKVPKNKTLLQAKKEPSNVSKSEEDMKEEIANHLMENLKKETIFEVK